MANIQPKKKTRQKYRSRLRGLNRARFNRLAKLIDTPRNDLAWHHAVGKLVQYLAPRQRRTEKWIRDLANALGPSPTSLRKLWQFAKLYRTRQDFKDLVRMGVKWTRVRLSLPVEGSKDRHELLQEAVNEGWNDEKLRLMVRQKSGSKRRGMGGRPPSEPQCLGAEPTLRKLAQLNRAWLSFHRNAWKKVEIADWNLLVFTNATVNRKKLRMLLRKGLCEVAKAAKACLGVHKTLKPLLSRLLNVKGPAMEI